MGKRLVLSLVAIVGCVLLMQQPASAHVLLHDSQNNVGAILHITPDDNPVAGQPTRMYFDIQGQLLNKKYATLRIVNHAVGSDSIVPATMSDTSVMVNYTFPEQGAYQLTLTVSSTQVLTFTHEQRVSQGIRASTRTATPYYPLATFALVLCGSLFVVLLIVAHNHRHAVHRHSTF